MTQRVELLAGQRQKGESYRAIVACNDYLRMGPRRSLRSMANDSKSERMIADRRSVGTLMRWSARYEWQKRAEVYDAELDAAKTARAREIMQTGLVRVHERVIGLKQLTASLADPIARSLNKATPTWSRVQAMDMTTRNGEGHGHRFCSSGPVPLTH